MNLPKRMPDLNAPVRLDFSRGLRRRRSRDPVLRRRIFILILVLLPLLVIAYFAAMTRFTRQEFVRLAETIGTVHSMDDKSLGLSYAKPYLAAFRSVSENKQEIKSRTVKVLTEQARVREKLADRSLDLVEKLKRARFFSGFGKSREQLVYVLEVNARLYKLRARNDRLDAGQKVEPVDLPSKNDLKKADDYWKKLHDDLADYALKRGYIDRYQFLLVD